MKKIVLWCMSTLTVLTLLFGYHTSTSPTAAGAGPNSSLTTPITGGTTPTAAAPRPAAGTAPPAGPSPASKPAAVPPPVAPSAVKVTGTVADTRYGPVQVQLTVANKHISNVAVLQYPNGGGRDQEINSQALPVLIQETLTAQSAHIDMVSGATYTSDGYLTSLQSALDQAGL